jgi:two-component system nitrate/nitrite response regulator NarL
VQPETLSLTMGKRTRILIVDDHVLLREGLVSLLQEQDDFAVVGEAGTVADAITMAQQLQPDLVLMDYGLPDGTGLDATEAILAEDPAVKIVFLTVHEADDDLFAAIRSGAKGYLLKNIPVRKMVNALRGMLHGEAPISREMTSRVLSQFSHEHHQDTEDFQNDDVFSPRELDVLAEIMTGATNKEIADHLFISVNTVKNHVHNMLGKLDLSNRRELVNYAESMGINPKSDRK